MFSPAFRRRFADPVKEPWQVLRQGGEAPALAGCLDGGSGMDQGSNQRMAWMALRGKSPLRFVVRSAIFGVLAVGQ